MGWERITSHLNAKQLQQVKDEMWEHSGYKHTCKPEEKRPNSPNLQCSNPKISRTPTGPTQEVWDMPNGRKDFEAPCYRDLKVQTDTVTTGGSAFTLEVARGTLRNGDLPFAGRSMSCFWTKDGIPTAGDKEIKSGETESVFRVQVKDPNGQTETLFVDTGDSPGVWLHPRVIIGDFDGKPGEEIAILQQNGAVEVFAYTPYQKI